MTQHYSAEAAAGWQQYRCYGSGARNARQLRGWVSRTSAVMAGVGQFAEHVPCSASLVLWVPVLESV